MTPIKSIAVVAMLAMSSSAALAQTATPSPDTATEPGAASPAPTTNAPAEKMAPPSEAITSPEAPSTAAAPDDAKPSTAAVTDEAKPSDMETTLSQSPGDLPSSQLVGATVYNSADENIGEVEDLIISSNGSVSAVVIGVGGFLGLGEKMIAMPYNALTAEQGDNNSLKIKVEGTKESLKSMPAYQYSS